MTRSNRSRVVSSTSPTPAIPALLKRTATRPCCSITRAANASVSASSVTSTRSAVAAAPMLAAVLRAASTSISATTTCAPSAAKSFALASPMPEPAPVMTQTLPSSLPTSVPPGRAVREGELLDRLRAHAGAAARLAGREVARFLDAHRRLEVLVQVIDVLDVAIVDGPADRDVVEHREMLDHLAEADAARVRAHRHAELRREQQDRDVLVDATDAARVDLDDVQGAGLQHLLEQDPVVPVLATRDADRRDGAADRGVAEDVVGRGRLFHPVRVELPERPDPLDGLVHAPDLVGVDRDPDVGADRLPHEAQPPLVVAAIGADLELDEVEAFGHRLAAEADKLGVVVAEPAGCRRVGGVAGGEQRRLTLGSAGLGAAQELERLLARERVLYISEVDEVDDLLGREVREQLPQRLRLDARPQVPGRIDHCAHGHVGDALLRTQPPVRAVVDQVAGEAAEVVEDRRDRHAGHERLERLD